MICNVGTSCARRSCKEVIPEKIAASINKIRKQKAARQ